jgi:predicted component of type VI protein secretion system
VSRAPPADPAVEAEESTRLLAGRLLRGGPLPDAVPHLRVLTGPAVGARLALEPEFTLGRGDAASARLDDPTASRLHARVACGEAGPLLQDLGSKNGLSLNGRRLRRPGLLRDGDRIKIGATELLVVAPSLAPGRPSSCAPPAAPARCGAARARAWTPAGARRPRRRLLFASALLAALAAGLLLAGAG